MSGGAGSLVSAVRAALAGRRRELARPPSPDELVAYREGRLNPAERERVEQALGAFPEAARALRDIAAFPAVEPADPADRLSQEDVDARWEAFRRRLAAAGAVGRRAPVVRRRVGCPTTGRARRRAAPGRGR